MPPIGPIRDRGSAIAALIASGKSPAEAFAAVGVNPPPGDPTAYYGPPYGPMDANALQRAASAIIAGQKKRSDENNPLFKDMADLGGKAAEEYGGRLAPLLVPFVGPQVDSQPVAPPRSAIPGDDYGNLSEGQPGWHNYLLSPMVVCTAAEKCTREEMADYLRRFSFPGQDPSQPLSDGKWSFVPAGPSLMGTIDTTFQDQGARGLVSINSTHPDHLLANGEVVNRIYQGPDGAWYISVHGFGNDVTPGASLMNQLFGPVSFDKRNQSMRDYIAAQKAGVGARS